MNINFIHRKKSLQELSTCLVLIIFLFISVSVALADFEDGMIRPAQLAFLTPDVADTLILNQIK